MAVIQSESDEKKTSINKSDYWLAEILPNENTRVAYNINFDINFLISGGRMSRRGLCGQGI